MSKPGLRVAVVHNAPVLGPDHPDAASEADVVAVARSVAEALTDAGFTAMLLPAGPPVSSVLERLERVAPVLIFNLIEGFGGSSARATAFTGLLELTGIPFTGSGVDAFAVCQSKAWTKAVLMGEGLPTARWCRVAPGQNVPTPDWEGPFLVKPDAEDGSLGIDQRSVVTNAASLAEPILRLHRDYAGAVLVEEYLPGPEFNVGVSMLPEPFALPVAQVVFADRPGAWPILTYASKWEEGSEEDLASPVVCPAPIDPSLSKRLQTLAVRAVRATGCRDYARVDVRLDARGEPMILEVNPNPDIGPRAGWARAARAAGIGYEEAIGAIARHALTRGSPP